MGGGWSKCSRGVFQRIGEHGVRAAELLMDHISNILHLCELSVSDLSTPETDGPNSPSSLTVQDVMVAVDSKIDQKRCRWFQTLRLYEELCILLAPHENEVQGLWTGLRQRGWHPERIEQLNEKFTASCALEK